MAEKEKYIMALDQGTTSSRAIIFNKKGEIVAKAQNEFAQHYPENGWVEHDPMEILFSQTSAMLTCLRLEKVDPKDIVGIGITNQRETTIVWEKKRASLFIMQLFGNAGAPLLFVRNLRRRACRIM